MRKFSVLFIISFVVLLVSCVSIWPIKNIINKYPFIVSITEILGFPNSSRDFNDPLALDIKMENGKRLFIAYIRSSKLKSPFVLYLIGKSTFNVHVWDGPTNNKGFWARSGIPIDVLSRNIQIELNSVEDVIENYDLIFNFTNSLTKLADINELLDIDDRYEIVNTGSRLSGRYGLGWREYVTPIIIGESEWFILNITQDEFPDTYDFYRIENTEKWQERYIHYRN